METQPHHTPSVSGDDSLSLKELLALCMSHWKWFVVSLGITLGVAVLYLLWTPSVYTRTASVLIKEPSRSRPAASDLLSFSDIGLFQSGANVHNELIAFQSPVVMTQVVRQLHLDMQYLVPGRFHRRVAYGRTLPVTVSMGDFPSGESARFMLRVDRDSTVYLSDFRREGDRVGSGAEVRGRLGRVVSTPLGDMIVQPTAYCTWADGEPYTLYVSRLSLYHAVTRYSQNLSVGLINERASVIELRYRDHSIQRAEDILSTIISVYNENWVQDKNQVAVSTSMFINERLGVIERELGSVDKDISSFKSEQLLPDVRAASSMYMAQSNATTVQLLELNNQLSMTRYIRSYMRDEGNRMQLLPANSGMGSVHLESQIEAYNTQLLQRNNLVANSSLQNPLVVDMDQSLSALRQALLTSIDNQVVTLTTQIESLQQMERQTTSRIAANPTQARYLLSVERQQMVKEALYLFLLQKREENELSQAFTAYNTRIIAPPNGRMKPTAPVRRNILLVALFLGGLIPLAILFLRESLNTRVRGRKDLESVAVPFIGEIPLVGGRKQGFVRGQGHDEHGIVVREGNRNAVNEAFRVLRTNLEFMTGKGAESQVILVTSFNPGSGKSFLTMNMAVSLAIKGKRVLVVDGDLRHATASSYAGSPATGLSDYLNGRVDDLLSIIVRDTPHRGMDVLAVGTPPPNPTELLYDARLGSAVGTLRGLYDYIFIDCPPIEIVADTQIMGELADRTVFVVRAGLLERGMLGELDRLYKEQKFRNMCMILNGTTFTGRRYGYNHGYYSSSGSGYYQADKDEK